MAQQDDKKSEIMGYYRERVDNGKYCTSPDFNLREVEIEHLSKRLKDGIKVLDVGCGNGYSTLSLASKHQSDFTGMDFVPEMITAAKELRKEIPTKGRVEFQVGDVTNIQLPEETFDVVISERCLLNLIDRQQQWQAMRQIAGVLKPGGLYLMLEGTLQGLQKLNAVRQQFGLDSIPEAAQGYNWFSNKFDEEELLAEASTIYSEHVETQRFGMYFFIARVIHPLLVAPENPKYDARINTIAQQIAGQMPNFEDMGHVALFVFRK
jgi:ubiquinone/menaquinone biosynthesis C-methylase UbiE